MLPQDYDDDDECNKYQSRSNIENNMALLLVVRVKIILYLLAIDFYSFIVLT